MAYEDDDIPSSAYGSSIGIQEMDDEGGVYDIAAETSGDAADVFLRDAMRDVGGSDPAMGMGTAADLNLGRMQHMSYGVQSALKDALEGRLDGSRAGLGDIKIAAAVESFAASIEGDPVKFARQLKHKQPRTVTSINPATGQRTELDFQASAMDVRTAINMLNTSNEYLTRGAGDVLPGNFPNADKEFESTQALEAAFATVNEYAELIIPDATKASSVYGQVQEQTRSALYGSIMDGKTLRYASDMPLPNELDGQHSLLSTSLNPTMGGWRGVTTPFTRFQYSGKKETLSLDVQGKFQPSVKNTIYPRPYINKNVEGYESKVATAKRTQKFKTETMLFKLKQAQKAIRAATPTTANESYGSDRYLTKTRNEDDWGWKSGALDEIAYQDLDEYASSSVIDTPTEMRILSSRDEALESMMEATEEVPDITYASGAHGEYQIAMDLQNNPVQHLPSGEANPAWLALRKGNITASALKQTGLTSDPRRMALQLASERLGVIPDKGMFDLTEDGNAYTVMGNVGEDKAARAFLANQGKGLSMEEAFFTTHPDHAGFGVSPDGKLFNEDGSSAGLLELKFLNDKSIKEGIGKFEEQVQLQMAITGEEQTHLYRYNRETKKGYHDLIKADPKMQASILAAGREAISLAEGLDLRGLDKMQDDIKSRKQREAEVDSTDVVGDEAKFVDADVKAEKPMTAFGSAEDTVLAKGLKKAEANAERTMVNQIADSLDPEKMAQIQAKEDSAMEKEARKIESKGVKELNDAAKASSDMLKNFNASVKKAAGVLKEISGIVSRGTESTLSESRLADEMGIGVEEVRGMREVMELGSMSDQAIQSTFVSAGARVRTFNDEQTAAVAYTEQLQQLGRSNIPSVNAVMNQLPTIQEQQGMDAQGIVSMAMGLAEGKSPEARRQILETFGLGQAVQFTGDASAIGGATSEYMDRLGAESQKRGELFITQKARVAQEAVGSIGYEAGVASATADLAAGVISSPTIGSIAKGGAAALGLGAAASKISTLESVNKSSKMTKALASAGKATPMAVAASLGTMGVRSALDIEDDGSDADSAMDILDFAVTGAAMGSVIPGLGTIAGGAAGTLVGIGNEAYEAFNAVPSKDIGKMANTMPNNNVEIKNDITVVNKITRTTAETEVNANGDIEEHADTYVGTGAIL